MKKSFCEKLRELRGNNSQQEFAKRIGVPQTSYSAWERGVKEPSFSAIKKLCEVCAIPPEWLLGIDDVNPKGITATNSAVHTNGNTHIKVATECRDCPTVARLMAIVENLTSKIGKK